MLHSRAVCGNAPTGGAARTGLELVLAGSHPEPDHWTSEGWAAAAPARVEAGETLDARTRRSRSTATTSRPAALAEPSPNLPEDDLRAI